MKVIGSNLMSSIDLADAAGPCFGCYLSFCDNRRDLLRKTILVNFAKSNLLDGLPTFCIAYPERAGLYHFYW
jgi:hypothetical protein